MTAILRVVIADDNYVVREGIRRLVADSGEVDVLAAVGNAEDLLDAVRRLRPDAVLTDIRMPLSPDRAEDAEHMEGIDAAHAIRADYPGIGVAVLSQFSDENYAFALLRNGTTGLAYLLKDRLADIEDVIRALREVAQGGSVIDPLIVDTLMRRTKAEGSPLDSLTPRELDVLREMARGKTNPGIGEALNLKGPTVEKHVSSIFSKLHLTEEPVHRRVAAVLTYLQERSTGQ
jgi:DNA-binding NarL/FixJ family response regulator